MKVFAIFLLVFSVSCSMSQNRQQPEAPVDKRFVQWEARSPELGLRKRVVVLPFVDVSGRRSKKVLDSARAAFIKQIVRTQRFVAIDPQDLPKDPMQFQSGMEYDMAAIAKMAAAADVAAVIEAKVLNLRAKKIGDQVGIFKNVKAEVNAQIEIRMFSTKTQKEIFKDLRTASVEASTRVVGRNQTESLELVNNPGLVYNAITKAFSSSIRGLSKAIEKMVWEGRIALIRGDRIYINAGRLSGLQVGDILRISSWGEEVFDPESGVFIGRSPGRSKGTIELINYFGNDGSVGIIHSGGNFQVNDKVELY